MKRKLQLCSLSKIAPGEPEEGRHEERVSDEKASLFDKPITFG